MLQFYFLSVALNIMTGLILVYGTDFSHGENLSSEDDFDAEADSDARSGSLFFNNPSFRLVISILAALTGILKLAATVHIKDDVSIFGDFFCVIAGIAGGLALFFDWRTSRGETEDNFLAAIFTKNRKFIGYFCIAAGFLHFVLPRVIFL